MKLHTVDCKDELATAQLVQALALAIRSFYTAEQGPLAQTSTQVANQPQSARSLHISLQGDLGSGKTTATRYLLAALGYAGKVKSPTYSLCEEHTIELIPTHTASQSKHTNIKIFHFDLYRMQDPEEWVEAGLAEHFSNEEEATLCIVEWPEKAEHTLPVMDLEITLSQPQFTNNEIDSNSIDPVARRIHFCANTKNGEAILASLQAPNS